MKLPLILILAAAFAGLVVLSSVVFDNDSPVRVGVQAKGPTLLPALPTATPKPQFNPLLISNSYAFVPDCAMPIPMGESGLSLKVAPSGPCDIFVADNFLGITTKQDGVIYELALLAGNPGQVVAGSEALPVLPAADCNYLLNLGVVLAGITLNGTGYVGPCQVISAPNLIRLTTQQGNVIELRRIEPPPPVSMPAPAAGITRTCQIELPYTVVYGNTLSSIARQFGVNLNALIVRNGPVGNLDIIRPGQQLIIPARC